MALWISGSYLVVAHRLANRTYAKATTGARGATVGVKQRIGRRNYEIGHNLTTKGAYLRQSRTRRRGRR
jgi:hypothetical protein